MNTREDLLKWLDDNKAFKDPERKTLSSGIARTLNKNKDIKDDFKRVTGINSDNSTELIYNIVFPNQTRVCEVCGKPVKFSAYYLGYKKTCSLSCAGKSASQKGTPIKLERYGSINNRQKMEKTKIERYGDPNYNNWEKSHETKQERYGDPNFNNISKAKETSLQKYGVDNVSKLPATVEKIKSTNLKRRGVEFPSQDPEVIKKMRESSKKKYMYEGMSFDSSWELAFYIMNKDAGHKVVREPIMIPYESRGVTYYYIPDFSVNGALYEMKGSQLIKDDVWVPSPESLRVTDDPEALKEKMRDKQRCAEANNVEVIDHVKIKPYLLYCTAKFGSPNWASHYKDGGVRFKQYESFLKNRGIIYNIQPEDLKLDPDDFYAKVMPDLEDKIKEIKKSLPAEFPYPHYSPLQLKNDYENLKSRDYKPGQKFGTYIANEFHKSIWWASTKGKKSPYEAWCDEDLMTRLIKNRLIYSSSPEITPEILRRGFSPSRVAPRVSLFNPALAKYLISKYLNEYDTIFDPFSGFSGRLLGTCSLGKRYIGKDINEDHIRESQAIIDYFGLDGEVEIKDVLESSGSYPCLFTCPPYGDKERWNGEKDSTEKSCDEWIQECLQRFDCEKYFFVVDKTEQFQSNIVEEIDNSSHMGKGKEYVVLI